MNMNVSAVAAPVEIKINKIGPASTELKSGFGQVMSAISNNESIRQTEDPISQEETELNEKLQELLNILTSNSESQLEKSFPSLFFNHTEISRDGEQDSEQLMNMSLEEFFHTVPAIQGALEKVMGASVINDLSSEKVKSPASLMMFASFAEKLAQEPAIKLVSSVSQDVLASLKGLTLAAQAADGPSVNSTILSGLSKTLNAIEEKLTSLQGKLNENMAGKENSLKKPLMPFFQHVPGFSNLFQQGRDHTSSSVNHESSVLAENKTENLLLNLQSLQLQTNLSRWTSSVPLKSNDQSQSLVQQFQQIMSQSKFGKANGTEKLMIRLQPEHLGTLRIELVQKAGVLTARVMTSTGIAKDIMDSQLHQLRQSLSGQNIQVEKIEVHHMQTEQSRSDRQMDQSSKQFSHQQEHEQSNADDEENELSQDFHQIFLNIEV